MSGSLKQYWWLHGDWPLTSNSQITTDHLEDLRKMCFVTMFPACGYYQDALGCETIDDTTPLEELDGSWKPGWLIIRSSATKTWESAEVVKLGCWRTVSSLAGDVYEALCDMGGDGEPANTTNPASSGNWRKINSPPKFLWVNTIQKDFEYPNTPTKDNFPMPDVHPAAGTWNTTDAGWQLFWDKNHYHSFDENSLAYWFDVFEWGGIENPQFHTIYNKASRTLPRQVDAEELNRPWVFQGNRDKDFIKRKVRFRKHPIKANWKKETITDTNGLGAIRSGTGYEPIGDDPEIYSTPYWHGLGEPAPPYNQFSSSKVCDSLQAMVEHLISHKDLCWPVNQTYIDNWEAVNNDTWDLSKAECTTHPLARDEYWGCNGSAFELILSELGEDYYDWYFDTNYIYWPDSVQKAKDNFEGFEVWKGAPLGTWRRTWKHSMGRVRNGFMRSSEMAAPTSSGYAYAIWDGADSGTILQPYWCGIHTAEFPDRDEFDTTFKADVELSASGKSGLWAGGTNLPPLNKMITCFDPADESAVKNVYVVKIEGNLVYFSDTVLDVSYSDEGKNWVKVGWNTDIQDRHDGIGVDCDTNGSCYPKYKLHWKMLQHCFKVLENQYRRREANIVADKLGAVSFGPGEPSSPEEGDGFPHGLISAAKGLIDYIFDTYGLTDFEWGGSGGVIGKSVNGELEATPLYSNDPPYDFIGHSFYSRECYASEVGLRLWLQKDDPTDWSNLMDLRNSTILVPVRYVDTKMENQPLAEQDPPGYYHYAPLFNGRPNRDYDEAVGGFAKARNFHFAGSIGGLAWDVVEYTSDTLPYKYGNLTIRIDDVMPHPLNPGITITKPQLLRVSGWPSTIESAPFQAPTSPPNKGRVDPDGPGYLKDYKGSKSVSMSFPKNYVFGKLDFDAVPISVFLETQGRNTIPAEEPEGEPLVEDKNPPVPNPARIHLKPKLKWQIIENTLDELKYLHMLVEVTAAPAEDLENSTPVRYRAITKLDGIVTSKDWGGSNVITFELRSPYPYEYFYGEDKDDGVLDEFGFGFTFTGTPIKINENTGVIDPADTTTPIDIWRFNITNTQPYRNNNQMVHAGDLVYIPAIMGVVEVVQATTSFIDIAFTEQPKAFTNLKIFDVSGYNLKDWLIDGLKNTLVAVQCKDDEGNETEMSEFVGIEPADIWPLDLYLKEEELNFYDYLEGL